MEANPEATAIPYSWDLDAYCTNPRVHLPEREVAISDYRLAALGILVVGMLC